MQEQIKKCEGCQKVKSIEQFNRSDGGHGHGATHYPYCKDCCKLRIYAATAVATSLGLTKQQWNKSYKPTEKRSMTESKFQEFLSNPPVLPEDKRSEKDKFDPTAKSKMCKKCHITKDIESFNIARGQYGRHDMCQQCHRLRHKSYTVAASRHDMTTREWTKTLPKKDRMVELEDIFGGLLSQVLEANGLPVIIDKSDKYTTTDPILNAVRQRHREELAKLDNKQTEIKEGFVYVVSNPAWPYAVKVGKAIDYEKRLNQFNTGDPERLYKLEHHWYFKDRLAAETIAHKLLKDKHISGEWFKTTPAEAAAVVSKLTLS